MSGLGRMLFAPADPSERWRGARTMMEAVTSTDPEPLLLDVSDPASDVSHQVGNTTWGYDTKPPDRFVRSLTSHGDDDRSRLATTDSSATALRCAPGGAVVTADADEP